jgi:hypothetical protein
MDRRFMWGVWLIVVSLFIGVAFKFYFLGRLLGTTSFDWTALKSYFQDPVLGWSTAIYLVSWLMLFLGIYLCGKQGYRYAQRFTKYITYRYYHRQAKKHLPRIARKSVRQTKRMVRRTRRMVDQGGKKAGLLVEQGTKQTRHILKEHLLGTKGGKRKGPGKPEKSI